MHVKARVLMFAPRMLDDSVLRQSTKRSLAAVVREERAVRTFTVADAVDLALDVCDALSSAHAEGIVHGDLGPHSVRIAWPRVDGRLKAIEIFSLERESDDDDPSLSGAVIALQSAVSSNGRPVKPTPGARTSPFLAPEQREVGRMIDPRADIWSIGALLRWMLRLDTKTATAPRGTPSPALLNAIEQCLALDPADRPQTVDEVAERIASFASAPAMRFERLAERRVQVADAKRALARGEKKDAVTALARLDANAMYRERDALSQPPACDERGWSGAAPDRLLDTLSRVARVAPAAAVKDPVRFPAPSPLDTGPNRPVANEADIFDVDEDEAETRIAISPDEDPLSRPLPQSALLASFHDPQIAQQSVHNARSSISPVAVSIERTPLPAQVEQVQGYHAPPPSMRAQLKTDPDANALRRRGRTILAIAAAAFATVAIGAGVGVGTSVLSVSSENQKVEKAAAAQPPPQAPVSPPPKADPNTITPASLPNAKDTIPTMTPSALPNAPAQPGKAHKKRVVPPGEKATESGDVLEDGLGQ